MRQMKALMASFPTGIGVVTAHDGTGRRHGMTCTSIAAVSLEPPCLLVCLRSASATLAAVRHRAGFALNLLHADAQGVAQIFASGAPDRFERTPWTVDDVTFGPHLHEAAHTTADCRLHSQTVIGDHTVVVGEVVRIVERDEPRPLMYGLRSYAAWPGTQAALLRS